MIKTYKARVNQNNVSYLLSGKMGNQVRYNFTNGNVIINKYPSITLRNRYYQELLESSLLYADNTIILDGETEEFPGEKRKLEEEKKAATEEKEKAKAAEEKEKAKAAEDNDDVVKGKVTPIEDVITSDELLAFVNKEDGRTDTSKMFKTVGSAMKWADAHNFTFPNYNPKK